VGLVGQVTQSDTRTDNHCLDKSSVVSDGKEYAGKVVDLK